MAALHQLNNCVRADVPGATSNEDRHFFDLGTFDYKDCLSCLYIYC